MNQIVQPSLICVFGLGMSGIAAARYLQRTGQDFFVADTRVAPPEKNALLELSHCRQSYFGEIPQAALNSAPMIILSPGVSPKLEALNQAKNAGVEIVGDVELFARQSTGKIVAITGSNGKSTVTDLTYQLLKASGANVEIGGNFGFPVLDFLPEDKADFYVLELSSFQLDTTHSLTAEIAVVLNVSEDHMDRYPNLESYRQSKLSIFNGAKKALVNGDDPLTRKDGLKDYIAFSLSNTAAKYHVAQLDGEYYLMQEQRRLFNTRDLQIAGMHNWSNALAALAIVLELGIELNAAMLETLAQYRGLSHRYQLVKSTPSVDWVNDSKATNVGATLAAIQGIDKRLYDTVILIAGGDAKGADISPLRQALQDNVTHLVVIGRDGPQLAALMPDEKVSFAKDMLQAVMIAKDNLPNPEMGNKSLVLLSPACASLDMYRNFAARGEAFAEAVEKVQ